MNLRRVAVLLALLSPSVARGQSSMVWSLGVGINDFPIQDVAKQLVLSGGQPVQALQKAFEGVGGATGLVNVFLGPGLYMELGGHYGTTFGDSRPYTFRFQDGRQAKPRLLYDRFSSTVALGLSNLHSDSDFPVIAGVGGLFGYSFSRHLDLETAASQLILPGGQVAEAIDFSQIQAGAGVLFGAQLHVGLRLGDEYRLLLWLQREWGEESRVDVFGNAAGSPQNYRRDTIRILLGRAFP